MVLPQHCTLDVCEFPTPGVIVPFYSDYLFKKKKCSMQNVLLSSHLACGLSWFSSQTMLSWKCHATLAKHHHQ